ncbi:MAG: helix-turn-helix domain-containing protein [Pirellulales bacterium]|nr:helix-turn-helix domain-containing protein [Pirellulales bacterium]
MPPKLLSSEEAARQLGVTVEQLTDMRQRQEIFGVRDGANWKYKEQDVARLAEELREQAENPALSDSGEIADLPLDFSDDDADVVLASERELGESDPHTSSTIIGRPGAQGAEESDIRLVTDDDRRSAGSSGVKLVAASDPATPGSDVRLVAEDSSVDLSLDDRPGPTLAGSESDIILSDDAVDVSLNLDDDFELSDLSVDVSADADMAADFDLSSSESDIDLSGESDRDEVVLGPTGGSDITLSPADSGISLASLSDTGLSLEEPLDLAASNEESLELGGDDILSLSDDSDSAAVKELAVDDDFLLTPLEEASEDSSSGSQVIALDSESDFGEASLLEDAGQAGLLEEDFGPDLGGGTLVGAGLTGAPLTAGAPVAAASSREAPYTTLNVISLGVCVLFLTLTGMMMADLLRNMWSWDTPYTVNSGMMDTILGLFEG